MRHVATALAGRCYVSNVISSSLLAAKSSKVAPNPRKARDTLLVGCLQSPTTSLAVSLRLASIHKRLLRPCLSPARSRATRRLSSRASIRTPQSGAREAHKTLKPSAFGAHRSSLRAPAARKGILLKQGANVAIELSVHFPPLFQQPLIPPFDASLVTPIIFLLSRSKCTGRSTPSQCAESVQRVHEPKASLSLPSRIA